MKAIILTAVLSITSISQADLIKCSFTEPFADTVYNSKTLDLTYEGPGFKKVTIKNVSLEIMHASVFALVDKNGKTLQILNLNDRGSDGMSDKEYPYSVQDQSNMLGAVHTGGCVSSYIKEVAGGDSR